MVRRVELTRIDDELSRQLSFAKRRNGLIKKALELFVVCGVDCVFISFSPSGRLSFFFGDKRAEEILARFAAIPSHVRRFHLSEQENQEFLGILNELKERTDEQFQNDRTVLGLQREISRAKAELESVTSEISKKLEPSVESIMTIEEANICEATIEDTLARVQQRMKELSETNENDATQASGYKIEAQEDEDEDEDDEGEARENFHRNRNNHQMLIQSHAQNSQVTFRERTPFPEMINNPYPRQGSGTTFSNLLMSADVPETLSPLNETVPHAPSLLPLLLSSQQPLDHNTRNSFHQNHSNLFPNTHQIYQNGPIPQVMQSIDLNGSTYGTPNHYFFPNSNPPSQQYHHLPANPFQPHMHLGESCSMAPFNGPQWPPNQTTLQQNPSLFIGQSGGYPEMLTSVSEMNNIYAQDAPPSAAYFRPPNLQMNHQQGLLGNQMRGIQGHVEGVGSPAFSNKRKSPWVNQGGIALRQTNNQSMHPEPEPEPPRTPTNAVYSNAYEMMGLPIDPHIRILEEINQREGSDSNHQQPNH